MSTPRRVLILTVDVGFGHRSAANAIAAALQENHPTDCIPIVYNPLDDDRVPRFLRDSQEDYDRMVREMPEIYKIRYRLSDSTVPKVLFEGAVTVLLYNILREIIEKEKPDAIVITHPMFPAPVRAVLAMKRLETPVITVVTDLTKIHVLWFNDSVDLCLVPTEEARAEAIEMGMAQDQVLVTGIPVHPRLVNERRSSREIRREFGWSENRTTLLVVSSKRVKNLEGVLHVLNHANLPIQMAVVAGGDDEIYHQLQHVEWHLPVYLFNFVENMAPFMRAADCMMSKAGGLITTEALACSLPLLMIDVTPGQEVGNAEYVIKHGAGEVAANPVDALEILFHWLDKDGALLKKYQANARAAGRPLSAQTIADLVWSAAERGALQTRPVKAHFLPRLRELLRGIENNS